MNETAPVKGCSVIYVPKGMALEYASLATNPYRGCGHGCTYCYVPNVLRMKRAEFDAGAVPRTGYVEKLIKDATKYRAAGVVDEQILLSFTTDPYHPGDTGLTRRTLRTLRTFGLSFCTLTKGGTRSLRDLDLFRPDRDSFGTTLSGLDSAFSRKWERFAALPDDRIAALKAFHDAGVFTWVSIEPTLCVEASLKIVEKTHEFVDLFKVGKANYLPITASTDWEGYTNKMLEVVNRLGVKHFIKKGLQEFLPAGYHNPMRIPQHF